jgi:hypothetical protein
MPEVLDEIRQREIFNLIVTLQDQGMDVRSSREQVAKQENISIETVVEIEQLGLENHWPPLE